MKRLMLLTYRYGEDEYEETLAQLEVKNDLTAKILIFTGSITPASRTNSSALNVGLNRKRWRKEKKSSGN